MAANEPFFSLDWAPDAIVVTGLDGSVLHVNPRGEDIFGYRNDELTDKPLELLIPEGLTGAALERSPLQQVSRTVVCAHRDGTRFLGTARWRPAPAGRSDFVVFSIRDLAGEERRPDEAAGDEDDTRVELLSLFAHDVRESLQAVQHLCDSLRDSAPAEAATASEIVSSVGSLLDRLTRFGQANAIEPLLERCRLGELLGTLGRELIPLAERKGLRLLVEDIDYELTTDPVLFRELLHNLLTNAIRYTKTGRVDVRCRGSEDHVQVEIADTGVGIAPERLASLLAGPKSSSRGSGLGLMIVRQLAQLLDCTIEVESIPGRGSCFTVVAPRVGPANRS